MTKKRTVSKSKPNKPNKPSATLATNGAKLKLDLAAGQNTREGFEGVDKWEGAQHVVNLGKYPWPFEDNSVAELHCSHFVEHIPMIEVDEHGNAVPFGEGQDAWLKFFDECYRILEPGGWITVITPCARSNRAFQDPTHRRFHVAESFLYLAAEWRKANKLDHYGAKCNFDVNVVPIIPIELSTLSPEVQAKKFNECWNTTLDFQAKLKAIK